MADSAELRELRLLARKLRSRATRKVRRIDTVSRVDFAGSKYDPRRDHDVINRYNRAQLKSYIAKLETFNSRATQFVPDARFRPIPIDKWRAYKKSEQEMNTRKQAVFDRYKDIRLPGRGRQLGMTIEEFERMTRAPVPQAANPAIYSPARPLNRKSYSVASEAKIKELINLNKSGYTEKDVARRAEEGRRIVEKILIPAGLDDLNERIQALSDEKFSLLWNYATKFAHELTLWYVTNQARLSQKENIESSQANALEKGAYKDVVELVDWAEKIKLPS